MIADIDPREWSDFVKSLHKELQIQVASPSRKVTIEYVDENGHVTESFKDVEVTFLGEL